MSYLWHQTIGGSGNEIDPANIPAERVAAARSAIAAALAADDNGVPILQRLGARLSATADRRRLLLTLYASNRAPIVTMAVAPRDRDGAKLWPMMVRAAADQGITIDFPRPHEPWALVLPYAGGIQTLARASDLAWLAPLEAELACAWLEMIRDR